MAQIVSRNFCRKRILKKVHGIFLPLFLKSLFILKKVHGSCDFVMGPRAKPTVPIDSAGLKYSVFVEKTHPDSPRAFSQFFKNDPFFVLFFTLFQIDIAKKPSR